MSGERPYKITYLVPKGRSDGRDSRVTSSFAKPGPARIRLAELRRQSWAKDHMERVTILYVDGPGEWWKK